MQTATAVATNEDQNKSKTVRVLFDSGSQRSYITDGVRRKLGLKSANIETLHLNTFGDGTYRKQRCEVVTCNYSAPDYLLSADGKVNLQDHPRLEELDFVTGETIRGEFGPTAVRGKLGWFLSGPTNNSQKETIWS